MKSSVAQYGRFLLAGIGVGLASIAFFEILRRMLGADAGWMHGMVVSLTYLFGALLSYRLQQNFVFARALAPGAMPFFAFFTLTIALSLVVGALSAALLSVQALRQLFGAAAPAASLIVAALSVSPLSFGATRLFIGALARR
jgi:hypothetical protein